MIYQRTFRRKHPFGARRKTHISEASPPSMWVPGKPLLPFENSLSFTSLTKAFNLALAVERDNTKLETSGSGVF